MSKVFVSGVAGFLGSHLAERLLADGHKVCGCDNLVGGEAENVPDGVENRVLTHGHSFYADCLDTAYMTKNGASIDRSLLR